MPAITSTIVAVGGLALSAGQMVKANKDKEKADSAAKLAAASIKNVTQENAFEALQAPDVKSLAEQANLQAQANTVNALQDMGPEGAAQIVNAGQAARQGNLQAAQAQAEANFKRDTYEANAQQGINSQQYKTEMDMEKSRLEGAQSASAAAEANKNAAIAGMFGSAGKAVTAGGNALSDYKLEGATTLGTTGTTGTTNATSANSPSGAFGLNSYEDWSGLPVPATFTPSTLTFPY